MKVKEENEKVGLKLSIQKTKIMVSGHSMFIAVLFTIAKAQKQVKCPSIYEQIKKMHIYTYIQWNSTQTK